MMPRVPFDLFGRLFGRPDPRPCLQFQIVAHGETTVADEDVLADLAERVGDCLEERASDLALGPVVGYDPATRRIEVEFTVDAISPEEMHGKVGQVAHLLEREGLLRYHDSTASLLDADEREPVYA